MKPILSGTFGYLRIFMDICGYIYGYEYGFNTYYSGNPGVDI